MRVGIQKTSVGGGGLSLPLLILCSSDTIYAHKFSAQSLPLYKYAIQLHICTGGVLASVPKNQGYVVYRGEQSMQTGSGSFISWRELDRIPD